MSITTNDKGLDGLTDATMNLWKQGLRVSFWPHHALQTTEYASLLLPPYQFDKVRRWLDLKSLLKAVEEAVAALGPASGAVQQQRQQQHHQDAKELGLWTLITYRDEGKQRQPRFRINT